MIVDDLARTVKGTKFTRALPPYPPARKVFAICICACKRDDLIEEMRQFSIFSERSNLDWGRPREVVVFGAQIGTIEEPG